MNPNNPEIGVNIKHEAARDNQQRRRGSILVRMRKEYRGRVIMQIATFVIQNNAEQNDLKESRL